jgi:ubiquinone/menaquinone biosynthesis C-methylase UbiE
MNKKDFFNQAAPGWDQNFYTPQMRERLPQLVSLFQLQKRAKILDVGAGTGGIVPYLLEAIGPEGSIWAIDFAEEMVKIGRKKFQKESRVIFEQASVEDLPYKGRFFDQIVCFGAFPHFEYKGKALEEMNRVLKSQGTLIIAHALSSVALRSHHQNCAPVSKDFLPEEGEMRSLLEKAGFQLNRLIDQPKCYLCEGVKTSLSNPSSPDRGRGRGQIRKPISLRRGTSPLRPEE